MIFFFKKNTGIEKNTYLCRSYSIMHNFLLIETSSEVCSVAVSFHDKVVSIREDIDCKSHISVITTMIEACIKEAGIEYEQLSAIGLSQGPGAYSSLRTGAGVAKGLCFALDIPLVAVDTLQALAWGAAQQSQKKNVLYLAMLDARRDEVWLAAYDDDNHLIRAAEPLILIDDNLNDYIKSTSKNKNADIFFCGNATPKAQKTTPAKDTTFTFGEMKCSAKNLVKIVNDNYGLGLKENLNTFTPIYMKPPNITTSSKKLF